MTGNTLLMALDPGTTKGAAATERLDELTTLLRAKGHRVTTADSAVDATAVITARADLAAALISWELPGGSDGKGESGRPAEAVLRALMDRFSPKLPVFLVARDSGQDDLPLWIAEIVNGWIWLLEDTPGFVAGRVDTAARHYLEDMLPPFFRALRHFEDAHKYSWHTPAHAGGVAFLKSPVGRAFHDYYGERLFRTDLSSSVGELGSLFEHTGPIGDAERHAAKVFGADHTYFVLNGTSSGDRIVIQACVPQQAAVLVDRNCHKAINHGIILSGARPTYLRPVRNGYGLTGPIPPERLTAESIREQVAANPITDGGDAGEAGTMVYAGITNSTYDGLCYDAVRVAELLGTSVRNLHFDEAWFAYARFNPLYERRYGMAIDEQTMPTHAQRPTVFTNHSTHKLLAALSQSAMIHVRCSPDHEFDRHRFNETFMLHASTSPLYPLIASNDVAAGMMSGSGGRWLTTEAITEAVRFRQAIIRLGRRFQASGERPPWFFGAWQPPEVIDPKTKKPVPFDKARLELLVTTPSCWTLAPGASWHGFEKMEKDYCLLDPVKVSITCPGVDATGRVDKGFGIPAKIVTAYLGRRGIVVEKTDAYTFLVLFSMGITKGKWGTLLDALTDFKRAYDTGADLVDVLPDLVRAHPDRYGHLTLPALCAQMHQALAVSGFLTLLNEAFTKRIDQVMSPGEAYQLLITGRAGLVRLDELREDHVVVTQVTTYPPGIPVLMPGEKVGPASAPLRSYLSAMEAFDRKFPGFESETHGIHPDTDGTYRLTCAEK
ncbi:arginine decarboxylase [Streptoalloteichus tenebrarius]|uniref:Arginine decarboxylase n=1 Tax=Streptoalloteichus tenebrarius (strain ATCC 17920 / DSM 40477 / JCM 4838 / CBS 697.72 / NBRC 16177 / NCIMB 11028 / NRRL B-12390 / A12253. 1 / ISP 5477) TaxID=1933 RepID=A0ABT1HPF5_STRSD|nr:Orn/Lys/Arg decarboxylase N-terminal domain-containing protein [Streptoalloteichus tenebrarius]MCP2257395.1 arginine decarboxylase [Streptoalloteichus tenebrarius]BFE98342.1 Orn/Lys/Arg decarboxylase N-terminal domain-containing protein [Streptoalloteichus tenebrarius]